MGSALYNNGENLPRDLLVLARHRRSIWRAYNAELTRSYCKVCFLGLFSNIVAYL